ncbi:hypothetical protein Ahu01nite_034880 [Winogradskya humida]|uniref:Uncharacterized protein n=1 Tax=Winogradskya humida TaxID=113566 RepID=A0ABQ3ZP70_9ACTN|nr:hypothetical protein Ahu01nite_034880 [Actinoplanes humidus]
MEAGRGVGIEFAAETKHCDIAAVIGHGGLHGIAFLLVRRDYSLDLAIEPAAHTKSVQIARNHPDYAANSRVADH